jgi:uncharacterized membrane protein YfcA
VVLAEPAVVAAVAAVVFAAALVSSIAGFAFSALAGAALIYLLEDPAGTVAILVTCSVAIHAYCTWRVWRSIDWRAFAPFVAGGAGTVPLGVWVLARTPGELFAAGLGLFLVAYGAYMILRRREIVLPFNTRHDVLVGALGGFLGGLAGFPGAAITVWCGMRGWSKERQRALCQPYILVMLMETLTLMGLASPAKIPAEAIYVYVPLALAAACAGAGLFQRLSTARFNLTVRVLLVVSGAALLGPMLWG